MNQTVSTLFKKYKYNFFFFKNQIQLKITNILYLLYFISMEY